MTDTGNNGSENAAASPADEGVNFWDWLGRILALLGSLPAIILAISIVYDHGFYAALGTSFGIMPTTLAYHYRNALSIVYWVITIIMVIFVLYLTNKTDSSKGSYIKLEQTKLLFCLSILITPMYFFTLSYYDLYQTRDGTLFMALLLVWFSSCICIRCNLKKIRNNVSFMVAFSFILLIPFAIFSLLLLGAQAAFQVKEDKTPSEYYIFEIEDFQSKEKGIIVRSFDRHWLIWNPCVNSNNIRLLNMDYVVSQQQSDIPKKDCPPKNLSSEEKDSSQTTTEP